jgi:hypothetical protein
MTPLGRSGIDLVTHEHWIINICLSVLGKMRLIASVVLLSLSSATVLAVGLMLGKEWRPDYTLDMDPSMRYPIKF